MTINTITELEQNVYDMKTNEGLSYREIGSKLGKSKNAVGKAYRRAVKKIDLNDSPGVVRTAEDMGMNVNHLAHGWMKTDDGSFFFKAPKFDELDQETVEEIIKGVFKFDIPRVPKINRGNDQLDGDLLTKYVLADVHVGMFAWAEEVGDDYDLKKAESLINETMDNLVDSTPKSKTAIILNLGDYFHANDQKNMTPGSGHILDMDSRFPKIATVGIRGIRYCIERALEKHEKVIYAAIPGNHDPDQTHWLTLTMMEAFRDNPRVEVRWNPRAWFQYTHGKNLLVAHHGDRTNFNRLAMAVPEHFAEEWGKTYWRFLDTGHIHHQKEHELGGLLLRSYRTIAAKDAYAYKSAYVAKRSLVAHTYHKTRGEITANSVHLFKGEIPT